MLRLKAPHVKLPHLHPAVVQHRTHITKLAVTFGILFCTLIPEHYAAVQVAVATNLLWIWA